jgi:hypothetical protein
VLASMLVTTVLLAIAARREHLEPMPRAFDETG